MKKYRGKKAGENILRTYDALLAQWGVDFEELYIPSRYGSTHVVAAGDKNAPPLVLFHGVGDDAALMWLYNAAELARHFRLYAVDTIGGPGKSEISDGYDKKSFDDVLWIDETLDGLGLRSAAFAGVSHGGYLVQLYLLARPERVSRAAVMASSVPAGADGSPMKAMMKIFLPEALFPTRANTLRLLKKMSGSNCAAFTENPAVMEHFQWLLRGFNNMAMTPHGVRTFSPEEIDAVRGRVVYLVGEKDPFQLLGGREVLLKNRMDAVFYPDAGHGLNQELPDEINQKLIEILK